MVRASRLLRTLPYMAGVLMTGVFLVGLQISTQTAAIADAQQAFYQYPIDVQVFWLQGKACVILPPDSYVAKCSYVPFIPLMHALTIMLLIVLGVYGLLRKRVNLLPTERRKRKDKEHFQ
ncbi:MAG TPA: hypothetical protein VEG61_05855 [Candidatus Dormibacteraeota bacterium]|nr:hypothetical protein [Candidatus Dormibacteraeota bacterium]